MAKWLISVLALLAPGSCVILLLVWATRRIAESIRRQSARRSPS